MRLLVLILLSLSLAASAIAQDAGNETTNQTGDAPGAGAAAPEPAGPVTVHLEALQEGSALFFRVAGETQRNPTLTFQPGQKVTFVVKTLSGVHNLNVGGEAETAFMGEGEEATVEWTAPETPGTLEYWCDPHKTGGMRGRIQVGAAPEPAPGGGGDEDISGDTIDLGQHDPACVGRRAPAAAAEGIVGLPTLQDYIDACKPRSEGPVVQAKSAADYVIPASWALIAVGLVGVVWVHKYYKP